jgi:L-asparagine transporter-like permease
MMHSYSNTREAPDTTHKLDKKIKAYHGVLATAVMVLAVCELSYG